MLYVGCKQCHELNKPPPGYMVTADLLLSANSNSNSLRFENDAEVASMSFYGKKKHISFIVSCRSVYEYGSLFQRGRLETEHNLKIILNCHFYVMIKKKLNLDIV